MFEWLINEGWEVNETLYKEIIGQGGAKEVDVFWDATKTFTDYTKFWMNIRFHPLGMTSVEIDVDGVKQKMNKGDLTIEFKSALLKDYNGNWDGNNFSKTLRNLYEKFMIAQRLEKQEAKLVSERDALVEYVKDFLTLAGRTGR
jgi:hypothetical protein